MAYLLAAVIILAFLAVLIFVLDKRKHSAGKHSKADKDRSSARIIKEANRRLARNPNDPAGLIALGNVYYTSEIWNKAYDVYSRLSKIDISDTHLTMKDCLLRLGHLRGKARALPRGDAGVDRLIQA